MLRVISRTINASLEPRHDPRGRVLLATKGDHQSPREKVATPLQGQSPHDTHSFHIQIYTQVFVFDMGLLKFVVCLGVLLLGCQVRSNLVVHD